MATTTTQHQEKQRKSGFKFSFYKSSSSKIQNPRAVSEPTATRSVEINDVRSQLVTMSPQYVLPRKSLDHHVDLINGAGGGRRRRKGSTRGEVEEEAVEVAVAVGRKSVSQVETNAMSVAAFLQVKVLVSDMPGFMQVHAFRCARTTYDSLDKFSSKHMAYNIKKEFDRVYGPAWHCIVGSNFGSYVTHSTGCFLYFTIEKLYILVFKTKVQKALD